jgi:predicted nucleic acid-binding Zn ribbon protein
MFNFDILENFNGIRKKNARIIFAILITLLIIMNLKLFIYKS